VNAITPPANPAPQAASVVDLLDNHLRDVGIRIACIGDRAGEVGRDSDLDRAFGGIGPVRPNHPAADTGRQHTGGEGEPAVFRIAAGAAGKIERGAADGGSV